VVTRVCWLVRSFIRSFETLIVLSRKVKNRLKVQFPRSLSATDIQHLRQISLLAFRKVKAKVEGQNRRGENLPTNNSAAVIRYLHKIRQSDRNILA